MIFIMDMITYDYTFVSHMIRILILVKNITYNNFK